MLKHELARLARPGSRQRQSFMVLADGEVAAWAEQNGLSFREAYQQALANGIFPESLERNSRLLARRNSCGCSTARFCWQAWAAGGYQAELLARVGVGCSEAKKLAGSKNLSQAIDRAHILREDT